uniref:NFACT RNA-binding domain-containing protein n=1 Tax=viral metagenome TaxID=1070528 RepID=A0A6C0I7C1_9ZZZZ
MKTEIFIFNNIEYIIYIGQNKNENWDIIDAAEKTDIWFHIENMVSCHVVLKNTNNVKLRDIPRQVIKRCAYLCKINSSMIVKSMPKCDVIYAPISEVVKTDIVGQVSVTNYKKVST